MTRARAILFYSLIGAIALTLASLIADFDHFSWLRGSASVIVGALISALHKVQKIPTAETKKTALLSILGAAWLAAVEHVVTDTVQDGNTITIWAVVVAGILIALFGLFSPPPEKES